MRTSRLGLAAVMFLVGALWVGQGTGVVRGSAMTGSSFWGIVGIILVLGAVGLVVVEWRRSTAGR